MWDVLPGCQGCTGDSSTSYVCPTPGGLIKTSAEMGGFQSLYCFYSTCLLGSQPRSQEGAWLLWTRHGTKRACTSEGHPDPLAHQVLVWRSSDVQSRLIRGRSPSGQSYQRGCPEEEAGRLQLQALCVLHEWGHTRGLMEHTPSQGVFREI